MESDHEVVITDLIYEPAGIRTRVVRSEGEQYIQASPRAQNLMKVLISKFIYKI